MEDEMERLKTENEGIFTAPVRGAYAFRVFSKAFGNPERAVTAGLFKNDQHIISTYGHQAGGFISSSNGVSLLLEEGDKVKVNLYPVSKVAFSVSLSSSNGPHSRPRTLIYKHIFLNTGDAYNSNTGIFTAPMKGVYAFKVFSKTYGSQDDKGVSAGLFRNSQHVISTYVHQKSGFIGSSNGVSLLLEKGDKIYVILYRTFSIFDNEYHHSTFSGHLLFPM
ncbi:complement C1q 2 isoform X2 [Labeo rohita]|uniref:Complement C1q 2 isoform X2 n=1 Tax=Labeo rohita TaxID=84645 RepID=A0A498M862_LABRO|nr:complement C1q 2 isoform X2 [Labeo rohita]